MENPAVTTIQNGVTRSEDADSVMYSYNNIDCTLTKSTEQILCFDNEEDQKISRANFRRFEKRYYGAYETQEGSD